MARTHPYILVSVGGQAVGPGFYDRLSKATITDATGQDSDRIELVFDDAGNAIAAPSEGALLAVQFGYRDVGLWRMGLYTVEQIAFEGGESGETLTLTGRSADMRSDLKEPLSEHFDDDTVGGIIQKLAARHGLQAKVSPELAGQKVPYIARLDQSTIDFGTRLADRNGALFSVKGGKMLLLKRGEATCRHPGDRPSRIARAGRSRPTRGRATAAPRPGGSIGRPASTVSRRPRPASRGRRSGFAMCFPAPARPRAPPRPRASTSTGRPAPARSSSPVCPRPRPRWTSCSPASGREINGLWRAKTVTHEIGDAYTTKIELEAPESGKKPP